MSDKTELDLDAERASFEADYRNRYSIPVHAKCIRNKDGDYESQALGCMWEGWLAARRATIQPTAATVGEIVLFGGTLKEVAWAKGKMPAPGTKLYAAPVAPADAVRDAERLDWLEQMGNEPEGLLLHAGRGKVGARGLGLSNLNRTLREAVDAAMRPTTPKEPAK